MSSSLRRAIGIAPVARTWHEFRVYNGKARITAGFRYMGGTGLEPVTPSLSSQYAGNDDVGSSPHFPCSGEDSADMALRPSWTSATVCAFVVRRPAGSIYVRTPRRAPILSTSLTGSGLSNASEVSRDCFRATQAASRPRLPQSDGRSRGHGYARDSRGVVIRGSSRRAAGSASSGRCG